ncbi:MAG: F0F1 ATP synthase subunit A [Mariprofundales bacterium]
MKLEPLSHFEIVNYITLHLFGIDISISNSVVWMWVASVVVFVFFWFAFKNQQLVPGRLQAAGEMLYLFIRDMIEKNIGADGRAYLPILFTLFYFILACNLLGLLPGAFTPTSQIIITAGLAVGVFIFTLILRLRLHGWGFFSVFAPSGLPPILLPLMIPIEVLSFLARPVSLAVRLFANMTAGHTVLGVIAFFGLAMPWFLSWIPLGFSAVLLAAELFIAVIQAYIFTILACVYIDDALHE